MFALLKLTHFISIAAFFGGLLSMQLLKIYGNRRGVSEHIGACLLIDRFIIPPSAAIITLTGGLLWWLTKSRSDNSWLVIMTIGWTLVGTIGALHLAPLLKWLEQHGSQIDEADYKARDRQWNMTNALAIVMVIFLFCLAIFRL